MARQKKEETLVHLDLEKMSKPVRRKKEVLQQDDMLPLTLGMILQQARQRKKLKLSDVSHKLRIKEIYLEALENGRYYAFPGLVYGIGFLRTYATFLDLDASEMVDRFYQETSGIKTAPMEMPQAENTNALPTMKVVLKTVAVFILLYLAWGIFRFVTRPTEPEISLPPPMETTSVVDVVEVEPETTVPVVVEELVAPETVAPVAESKPEAEPQKKPTAPPEIKTERKESSPLQKGVSYGLKTPARVSFVATDRVWIEVRDTEANRILINKILESGDRYNPVEDAEGLVLKTANAGALSLYIDGHFVRTMGEKGMIKSGILMRVEDLERE